MPITANCEPPENKTKLKKQVCQMSRPAATLSAPKDTPYAATAMPTEIPVLSARLSAADKATAPPSEHFHATDYLGQSKKPLVVEDQGLSSPTWTRTMNLRINSALLCQLSYRGLLLGVFILPQIRTCKNRMHAQTHDEL